MIVLKSGVSNFVNLDNRIYTYFGGNNYLGLASHPEIIKAAVAATEKYGLNFSASRQTTGTSELHLQLEKELSGFQQKEDAVVFASGYLSNRILLQALKGQFTALYYDELAHPSIIDAFPNEIPLISYPHNNPAHLEQLLKEKGRFHPLIITDGIFPLTGEMAPLDKIMEIAQKYSAIVVVDDAHSAGVAGKNGRGTAEFFGLENLQNIYQTGTLSKAFGVYGGFISSEKGIVQRIREVSSCYLASTALPPAMLAAAIASIRIIGREPELRTVLQHNSKLLKAEVQEMGFSTSSDPTPIIPLFFNSEAEAVHLSQYLKENNIIVPYVKYPVKMDKFIVRITTSTLHTQDQIQNLLNLLNTWRKNK